MTNQTDKFAFVIMEFNTENDDIYNNIIKPSIEKAGVRSLRADSFDNSNNIIRDIIEGITRSSIVIAEISTLNANVMYELGIAHALNVPTVMLTQDISQMPFDLRSYRMYPYGLRYNEVPKIMDKIYELTSLAISGNFSPSSPVTDFSDASPKLTAKQALEPGSANEVGSLDFIEGGMEKLNTATSIAEEIAKLTSDIGQFMSLKTEEVSSLINLPQNVKKIKLKTIISEMSKKLIEYANNNNEKADQITENMEMFYSGFINFLETSKITSAEDRQALINSTSSTLELIESVSNARSQLADFKIQVVNMGKYSTDLLRASRLVSSSLDKLDSSLEIYISMGNRSIEVINKMLED